MRRYVKPTEPHPYNSRSDEDKVYEAKAYHLGMMKFLEARGCLNLAYSHYLHSQDVTIESIKELNERN